MSELGQSLRKLRTRAEYLRKTVEVTKSPIGIKTPLEKGSASLGESLFKMHFDVDDQIMDNLKNLIMTQKGERLGFSDFGTNLNAIYSNTSLTEDDIAEIASNEVSNAVKKYMPSIKLTQFYSQRVGDNEKNNYANISGLNLANNLSSNVNINNSSSKELNKNNKDVDSIHKITIEFTIPALSNQKRSIELFINSGK